MKGLFLTLTVILFLFSCKTTKQNTSNQLPEGKRYAIGQGGGFTGVYSEFILSENGQVHKYDFKYDREVYFKDLKKVDLIYFLEKIEALGLEGLEMKNPGNMTKYIDIRYGRNSINKIVWGHPNYNPDEEMVKLHEEMYNILSTWD
ncbi:MAG: hypothetical protein P8Q14_04355 [Vicingaceae bacterium]|nr:hypothetical protein [Vicingaceae bacterium]